VPSLLVQPFIENALVHGLLHKSELKTIQISFKFKNNILTCIIEDNGIGRQRASEIAKRQGKNHQSFALTAIEKRLDIFNKQHQTKVGYTIIDLYQDDKAIGTRVEIIMPFERSY
jgi:sensor histidine kinase YesM